MRIRVYTVQQKSVIVSKCFNAPEPIAEEREGEGEKTDASFSISDPALWRESIYFVPQSFYMLLIVEKRNLLSLFESSVFVLPSPSHSAILLRRVHNRDDLFHIRRIQIYDNEKKSRDHH